jgi:hypothetical protein
MGLAVAIKYAFPLRIKTEKISPSHGGTLFMNSYLLVFEMHPPLFIRIFLEYFLTSSMTVWNGIWMIVFLWR